MGAKSVSFVDDRLLLAALRIAAVQAGHAAVHHDDSGRAALAA
jgi:hypothetical protein